MKRLEHIAKEIGKGNNLGENLEKYAVGMAAMYNGLAYIKFSMNYYTVCDYINDGDCKDELFLEAFAKLNDIVKKLCDKNYDRKAIEELRDEITRIMEVVVAYVDRLRVYEHALNRVEYRFNDTEFDEEYYSTYLTNELMHYILSDKDSVVINNKIQTIVGQLPMRLSKAKFFEYLRDAFSLYHGSKTDSVDDFVYTLASSAMLDEPKHFDEYYPQMKDIYDTLANGDYVNLDGKEYERLSGALKIGSDMMNNAADIFVMLAQLVNDLFTVIITQGYSLLESEETDNALKIIEAVHKANADGVMAEDEVLDRFVSFEGVQEKIFAELSKNDYLIDEAASSYEKEIDEYGLRGVYDALFLSVKLQSGSDFVSLNKEQETSDATDEYVDASCEKLIDKFTDLFAKVSQPVKRAVMASVLSQLPVFFNNTDQIHQYINVSLMQCSDLAEKKAVVEVLKQIMSEE